MDAKDFLKEALEAAKQVSDETKPAYKKHKISCRIGWHDWNNWQAWGTGRYLLGEVPIHQNLIMYRLCQNCNKRQTDMIDIIK